MNQPPNDFAELDLDFVCEKNLNRERDEKFGKYVNK